MPLDHRPMSAVLQITRKPLLSQKEGEVENSETKEEKYRHIEAYEEGEKKTGIAERETGLNKHVGREKKQKFSIYGLSKSDKDF